MCSGHVQALKLVSDANIEVCSVHTILCWLQVAQPPPEKKPRLEEDAAASTSPSVDKGVGVPNAAEDDDVIPKIKSSHLNLDDIPVELLPTHQEKIMKQV